MTAVLLCGAAIFGQGTPPSDPVFRNFLAWYKTYKGTFIPQQVTEAYAKKLAADGVDKAAIEQQMAAIWSGIRSMPVEYAALHFDHIYTAPDAPFRTEPSRFLSQMIEGRKPGRALDVGMGQGRNAVFLARKGWDVTGYDISEEGLAIAQRNAAAANVKLSAVRATHQAFNYGKEQWDLIAQVFAFSDLSDPAYRKRVIESLKPGGLLLIEGFGDASGNGPRNVMLESFKELRIIYYEDRDDVADWSMRTMRVTRLAAEKP